MIELRRIGLPTLEAKTQPADKTLVNFATIFYTEAEPFTTTVRLLGQQVNIEATPAQFSWHFGDGSTRTTASPGAPYPSKELTYSYSDADTTVQPSVDVTYTARSGERRCLAGHRRDGLSLPAEQPGISEVDCSPVRQPEANTTTEVPGI
jgi:hypothetical protein